MIAFDANVHLPRPGETAEQMLMDDTSMDAGALLNSFNSYQLHLGKRLHAANFMVLTNALSREEMGQLCISVERAFPGSAVTWMADFRAHDAAHRLAQMKEVGVAAVKFHSYVQQIGKDDVPAAVALAKTAGDLGLPILIDTSYGGVSM